MTITSTDPIVTTGRPLPSSPSWAPGARRPDGRDLARGGLDVRVWNRTAELAAQAIGATLTLTSALLPRWRDAAASGHADDDPFASTSRHDQRSPKYHGQSTGIAVAKVRGSRSACLSQPRAVTSVIE